MKIEVWADVVCPWCYIGKRRLERAIEQDGGTFEVRWRSFELDATATHRDTPVREMIARKYGMAEDQAAAMIERVAAVGVDEGLEFDFASARTGNTFAAHQIAHFAADHGQGAAMMERLMRAYFCDGAPIGEADTLISLAESLGLDAGAAREALADGQYASAVREDEAAARDVGAHGVPFFLIEGKYAVSGAQESATLVAVFEQVRALSQSAAVVG